MNNKDGVYSRVMLIAFAVIVMSVFVFAGSVVKNFNGNNNMTVTEDVYTLLNFSLNTSVSGDATGNITELNVTFPSSITIDALGTNSSLRLSATEISATNLTISGSTISFRNGSAINEMVLNASVNGSHFSVNISAATPGNYNITIFGFNTTFYSNTTHHVFNATIDIFVNDTTAPTANISGGIANSTGVKGVVNINVTVQDDLNISYVEFNITNSTGQQNVSLRASAQGSGPFYNVSLDTSTLPEGKYNLTVIRNDTAAGDAGGTNAPTDIGMIAKTVIVKEFKVDRTNPTVSLARNSGTSSSLTIAITVSDSISAPLGACSSSRSGSTVTGTGASQTLTESALACGNNYTYIITCGDEAGNQGSVTTGFATDNCGGGSSSSSSGGGSTTTWTKTIVLTDEQFTTGYTNTLSAKNRVKVKVGSEDHYVGVTSLTTSSATIEISSDPVSVALDIGEDAKVDVDDDNFYDIYAKLNSIADNKADLTIKKINEAVPEGEGAVGGTGDVGTGGTDEPTPGTGGEPKGKSLIWLWILIVVVIVVAIVVVVYQKNKK